MFAGCGSVASLSTAPEQEAGVQERFREGRRILSLAFERPKQRTHPSWFEAGTAFLTLCPQKTGAAMANASGIQDPKRAIALRSSLLGIQRTVSRATQRPIRLQGKRGTRKAPGKRRTRPLGRTIRHRRSMLRDRFSLSRRDSHGFGKFRGAQIGRGELLPQFQAQVPNPLRENLAKLLAAGHMGVPPIRILYSRRLCVYVMLNTHRKLVSLPTTS